MENNNNNNNDNTIIMENGNNGESDWRNNLDFMEMMMKIERKRRKFMTNAETDEYYKKYKQEHDISKDRKINLDLVGKLPYIDYIPSDSNNDSNGENDDDRNEASGATYTEKDHCLPQEIILKDVILVYYTPINKITLNNECNKIVLNNNKNENNNNYNNNNSGKKTIGKMALTEKIIVKTSFCYNISEVWNYNNKNNNMIRYSGKDNDFGDKIVKNNDVYEDINMVNNNNMRKELAYLEALVIDGSGGYDIQQTVLKFDLHDTFDVPSLQDISKYNQNGLCFFQFKPSLCESADNCVNVQGFALNYTVCGGVTFGLRFSNYVFEAEAMTCDDINNSIQHGLQCVGIAAIMIDHG